MVQSTMLLLLPHVWTHDSVAAKWLVLVGDALSDFNIPQAHADIPHDLDAGLMSLDSAHFENV